MLMYRFSWVNILATLPTSDLWLKSGLNQVKSRPKTSLKRIQHQNSLLNSNFSMSPIKSCLTLKIPRMLQPYPVKPEGALSPSPPPENSSRSQAFPNQERIFPRMDFNEALCPDCIGSSLVLYIYAWTAHVSKWSPCPVCSIAGGGKTKWLCTRLGKEEGLTLSPKWSLLAIPITLMQRYCSQKQKQNLLLYCSASETRAM